MIRPMTLADADAVAALIRAAFAAIAVPLDPAPSALHVTGDTVRTHLAGGGGAVWEEDGLRGGLLWAPQGNALYLGRLAVAPGWQGRGIASDAAAAVVDWLVGEGVPVVRAFVHPDHGASAAVAARAGLAPTTELIDGEVMWRRAERR